MGEGNCSFSDPERSALEMIGLESKTSRKNPPYNLTVNKEVGSFSTCFFLTCFCLQVYVTSISITNYSNLLFSVKKKKKGNLTLKPQNIFSIACNYRGVSIEEGAI